MSIINAGLAVLTSEDAIIRREIEKYLSNLLEQKDYLPVYSPHIGDISLFETSGHYPYYKESMFNPIMNYFNGEHEHYEYPEYLLKPMNCPFHIQAYQEEPRSYKELPIRYYEFGTVYRNEASGAINGMFRLRGFTQDDGHIFCTMDQVENEVRACISLVHEVMNKFGLTVICKLSTRDLSALEHSYIGEFASWLAAEDALSRCVPTGTVIDIGGAAFYGPKIDFVATDKLGREWQLGTVQLDFNLPDRFKMEYKSKDNESVRPVMIHRALLGSIERFIAILKEQGPLPVWLCKEQIRVIPVHEDQLDYAKEVSDRLCKEGFRSKVDEETAPLSAKVKNCITDKIPVRIVVGPKDLKERLITARLPNWEKDMILSLNAFISTVEYLAK